MSEEKPSEQSAEEMFATLTKSGWGEFYTANVLHIIEAAGNPDLIRHYYVSGIIVNGDKTLIKWEKRYEPLTDEKMKSQYGIK